ncbi:MAG: hypothetical protein IJ191_09195 [Treponema sp.]|nr:hypothetical protein [Treponema sp.]
MTVSQAAFARMAGVSRASVCGKVKNKTLIVDSGGMIDTDNPVNREYLELHQQSAIQTQTATTPATASFSGTKSEQPAHAPKICPVPKHRTQGYAMTDSAAATAAGIPEELLGLTIRELIARFGTMQNVEKYVKILRDLTAADEKDQRMRERRMMQIPKDFVTSQIFGLLEQMTNRLLDMPERIVDGLIALAATNDDSARQKIINSIRDNVSITIGDTKNLVIKQLEALKTNTNDNTDTTAAIQDLKEQISELTEQRGD